MEEISSENSPFKDSLSVLMHKLVENVQLKTYSDVYSSVGNSDPNQRETKGTTLHKERTLWSEAVILHRGALLKISRSS